MKKLAKSQAKYLLDKKTENQLKSDGSKSESSSTTHLILVLKTTFYCVTWNTVVREILFNREKT